MNSKIVVYFTIALNLSFPIINAIYHAWPLFTAAPITRDDWERFYQRLILYITPMDQFKHDYLPCWIPIRMKNNIRIHTNGLIIGDSFFCNMYDLSFRSTANSDVLRFNTFNEFMNELLALIRE